MVSPSTMRRFALDQIAEATGGSAERIEARSQTYRCVNGAIVHVRTRQRDERGPTKVYWFGVREECWNEDEFFAFVCAHDFVVVVPVRDWLPYHDTICLSGGDGPNPARQPHLYWGDGRYELREGDLAVDLTPWVNRFDLLTMGGS